MASSNLIKPFRPILVATHTATTERFKSLDVQTALLGRKRSRVIGYFILMVVAITNSGAGAAVFPAATDTGKEYKYNLLKEVGWKCDLPNAITCKATGWQLSRLAPRLGFIGNIASMGLVAGGASTTDALVPDYGSIANTPATTTKSLGYFVPLCSLKKGSKAGQCAPSVGNAPRTLDITVASDADVVSGSSAGMAASAVTIKVYALVARAPRFGRNIARPLAIFNERMTTFPVPAAPRGMYEDYTIMAEAAASDTAFTVTEEVALHLEGDPGGNASMEQGAEVTAWKRLNADGAGFHNAFVEPSFDDNSDTVRQVSFIEPEADADVSEMVPCTPKITFATNRNHRRFICYVPYAGEVDEKQAFLDSAERARTVENDKDSPIRRIGPDIDGRPSGRKDFLGGVPYVAYTEQDLETMGTRRKQYDRVLGLAA